MLSPDKKIVPTWAEIVAAGPPPVKDPSEKRSAGMPAYAHVGKSTADSRMVVGNIFCGMNVNLVDGMKTVMSTVCTVLCPGFQKETLALLGPSAGGPYYFEGRRERKRRIGGRNGCDIDAATCRFCTDTPTGCAGTLTGTEPDLRARGDDAFAFSTSMIDFWPAPVRGPLTARGLKRY